MIARTSVTRAVAALGATAVLVTSLAGCSGGLSGSSGGSGSSSGSSAKLNGPVTIKLLAQGNDPAATAQAKGIAEGFQKANPKITVKVDTRPAGTDGDNLVKTRLSTGEMEDVFLYNTGSLFQVLRPDTTLQPLTDEPWVKDITDDFKTTVSTDKGTYGAPIGTTFGGGVMYNKKVYEKLGLKIPQSWDEFIANSNKIKAAGIVPVLQTFGDDWTSQLFVLGSFASILASDEKWPEKYTKNDPSAKYSVQPALQGFEHTQEVHDKGLINKDYASLTNANGLKLLAEGKAAQYPMIGAVISNVQQSNPDQVNDIGMFALPADKAENTRLTIWEPAGAYIPKTTTGDKLVAAKKLVAFINSKEGCAIQNKTGGLPAGPFAISTCEVPSDAPAIVADTQKYVDENKSGLALEFLSPVKGPGLPKILVQVGSGISSAKQGAKLYDDDLKKQAQQLGLKEWG